MKQLTSAQALALGESGEWKDWTDDEIVRLQLFQDKLCVPLEHYQQAIERVLGRPVFTHEFRSPGQLQAEYLGQRPAPTLDEIIGLIP